MHQVILDRLEEHLSGSLGLREFTAHLETCAECRAEVREMQELSSAFVALRATEQVMPQPGFYARLTELLEGQKARPIWGLFRLDPAFGKRVAFASLMTLTILGSFLITRETEYSAGPPTPEMIMAQQAPAENPDSMLATLVTFEP